MMVDIQVTVQKMMMDIYMIMTRKLARNTIASF